MSISMSSPPKRPFFRAIAQALRPLVISACIALALVLAGELANEFHTEGFRARWYDLTWLGIVVGYLVLSPTMVLLRLWRREYLRAISWMLIGSITASRVFDPRPYRDIEDRIVPYTLAALDVCEAPVEADARTRVRAPFTVCYAHQRFPWDHILIRDPTGEMLRPEDQWSDELKAAIGSNRFTENIVMCGYRRITPLRANYLFVEVACG